MKKIRAHNCWEFWDCHKVTREKCPAYRTNSGRECFNLARDFCPKITNEFKHCWECPWYKEIAGTAGDGADDLSEYWDRM